MIGSAVAEHAYHVADRLGLPLRTARHHEEVGLVTPSDRISVGLRLCTDDDVERLELVKHLEPLGVSLDEMRDLHATTG